MKLNSFLIVFITFCLVWASGFSDDVHLLNRAKRVIGGEDVRGSEISAIVQILIGRRNFVTCSGSLVGPDTVLTAAHCVNKSRSYKVGYYLPGFRLNPQLNAATLATLYDEGRLLPFMNTVRVKSIHVHPEYHWPANDIAIFKLETRIEANDGGQWPYFQMELRNRPTYNDVIVYGYGRMSNNGSGEANDYFRRPPRRLVITDRNNQCFLFRYLNSFCRDFIIYRCKISTSPYFGDSGGPMVDAVSGRQIGVYANIQRGNAANGYYDTFYGPLARNADFIRQHI